MKGLVRAAHAQPTLVVTAVVTMLAAASGRSRCGVVAVGLAMLAGQLSVGWSNDYIDRDRDRATGRVDKPIVAGSVSERAVGTGAAVALLACVALSYVSGWRAGTAHTVAVLSGWAYNAGVKATVASPVPYAVSFGLLPAFVSLGLPGHPWPPAWLVVGAALLGTGAHFVNTVADAASDAASGIRGLPQRIGPERSLVAGALLLCLAAGVLAVAPGFDARAAAGLLVAVAGAVGIVVAGQRRPRLAWTLTLVTALAAVTLLVTSGARLG